MSQFHPARGYTWSTIEEANAKLAAEEKKKQARDDPDGGTASVEGKHQQNAFYDTVDDLVTRTTVAAVEEMEELEAAIKSEEEGGDHEAAARTDVDGGAALDGSMLKANGLKEEGLRDSPAPSTPPPTKVKGLGGDLPKKRKKRMSMDSNASATRKKKS
ncbi:hypothetical protein HK104_010640 [Borealophlyctis nickersoniae]|nr:hypothetical protein HK104_010640 [Borealophlyctis nickersoniae]